MEYDSYKIKSVEQEGHKAKSWYLDFPGICNQLYPSGLRGERIYSFHCSLIAFLVGNIGMSESSVRLRPMGADIFLCTTICPLASRVCAKLLQLCLTLCDPMDSSTPGSSVLHYLLEFAQTHVHCVDDTSQPSHPFLPLLPLPLLFPSNRVFSSELPLCIRWLKLELQL